MAPVPFPTQLSGYPWLAARKNALLADEPRVGKTGTTIMALDDCLDAVVLVITTASGRAVWRRAFKQWSRFDRPKLRIVGWGEVANPKVRAELLKVVWDRIVVDESHYAKSFEAKRTQSVFGTPDPSNPAKLLIATALFAKAKGVWCLSGTPLPHDPADIFPMMRALCPGRLTANPEKGWPDVMSYEAFRDRYTKWRPKKLNNWRTIIVIMGGKNEAELRERLGDFMLLRTQADAGIRPPVHEVYPLSVTPKMLREVEGDLKASDVLAAAKAGNTRDLDMHLGPLRRMTGEIKARAMVDVIHDEFASGLDKVVLAYWHRDVGQILKDGLAKYGVTGIDGASTPKQREAAEQGFLRADGPRVFLAQIEAAGEAIDLSSAAVLYFVETVFSPKAMKQMSLRITNHTQSRQAVVRVCALEGSIDEALQEILLRLWAAIREVLKGD